METRLGILTIVTRFFIIPALVLFIGLPLIADSEATSADVQSRRSQLESQLAALEKEIADQTVFLEAKQKERVSLERDVAILDAQIEKARLSIRARDLSIQALSSDIGTKADTISALDEKLAREKQSLAELFRRTKELNDSTLIEVLLSSQSISRFFEDIDDFAVVKKELQSSFVTIADTKAVTTEEKTQLENRRVEEQQLRQIQVLEQNKIVAQQKERQNILKVTKGEEDAYQTLIKSKQKSAAQIRSELFALRDSAAIPFGTALDLANFASQKTGVRSALILGVLKQETALGENLGTGSYLIDMHPTRDVPVFLKITETLGYDPGKMPVSRQPGYGWGGAMGPSQFIPSTWACFGGFVNTTTGKCGRGSDGTYAGPWAYSQNDDVIRKLVGKGTPSDPWNNQDAFMATALLLKDNGAAAGTYQAERLAALRYFAGWANATKRAYAFYGDGVMEHAAFFQSQIDILGG